MPTFNRYLLCLLGLLTACGWSAEVRLTVAEPSGVARSSWPVTSGIPLGRGALRDAGRVALFDGQGKPLPLQTEVLTRWPDGSIRWLLLDFPIDLRANETSVLKLRYGKDVVAEKPSRALRIEETDDAVTLNTGALKLEVSKKRFRLLDRVWLDRDGDGRYAEEERVTASEGAGIEVTAPNGDVFRAESGPCQIRIEQRGPLRACLRMEGDHTGPSGKMFRYIVRLHAWRGQSFVRLHYTFLNDNKPELMSKIESLELTFAHARKSGEPQALLAGSRTDPTRLFQVDDRRYEINGQSSDGRAVGWAHVGDQNGGIAVGVREFWQNWPKSLKVDPGKQENATLRVGILPSFPKGLYDGKPIREEAKLYYYLRDGVYSLKIGAARTHELWAHFSSARPEEEQLATFFRATETPLLAQCTPQYVRSTRAAGDLAVTDPKTEKFLGYEALIKEFLEHHLHDRDKQREYGLLNYGDWYWARNDHWGNLEYDLPRCFFAQYFRSGDRRYFDRAEQAARHYIDVDVTHAVNRELLAYGGSNKMAPGSIWAHSVGHTGGYYGRWDGGEYHDLAPLGSSAPYQLGLSDLGHHWMGGEFDYYCLTGDRRALEVAVMASDVISKRCPTAYTDHIRGIGWPLNMMLDAYDATGDRKYLEAATKQWERLKEHLDLDKGYQVMLAFGHCNQRDPAKRCYGQNAYMLGLTLAGVVRYHQITQDPEVLAGLRAGVEQLIRECYSEKHKSFYLTSCTCLRHRPPPEVSATTFLGSFAIAYESKLTGNREHRRILRESLTSTIAAARKEIAEGKWDGWSGAHSAGFRFTPYALIALENER
jgi:hypothetical protein